MVKDNLKFVRSITQTGHIKEDLLVVRSMKYENRNEMKIVMGMKYEIDGYGWMDMDMKS